jgi:DNA-binding NtrC family response regulator
MSAFIETGQKTSTVSCEQGAPLARTENPLVYIVDDEKSVGEIVELLFQLQGYRTRLFFKPELALEAFKKDEQAPNLLVTDYVMSPINGMELIAHAVKIDPKLKTILISGNVGEDVLQGHSIKPGVFIRKPFVPDVLMNAARKLLSTAY